MRTPRARGVMSDALTTVFECFYKRSRLGNRSRLVGFTYVPKELTDIWCFSTDS
jgi:hypothetical protein